MSPSEIPKAMPSSGELTRLLQAWREGDLEARDRLMPVVYEELRRRAKSYLKRKSGGDSLKPTDLVHEAYLRLCKQTVLWKNREQFFGIASQLMRRILVDHARSKGAAKRGAGLRVTLDSDLLASTAADNDILAIDSALEELGAIEPRLVELVELRFFGGLTIVETAEALGISLATANRDWAIAKAWLQRRLRSL